MSPVVKYPFVWQARTGYALVLEIPGVVDEVPATALNELHLSSADKLTRRIGFLAFWVAGLALLEVVVLVSVGVTDSELWAMQGADGAAVPTALGLITELVIFGGPVGLDAVFLMGVVWALAKFGVRRRNGFLRTVLRPALILFFESVLLVFIPNMGPWSDAIGDAFTTFQYVGLPVVGVCLTGASLLVILVARVSSRSEVAARQRQADDWATVTSEFGAVNCSLSPRDHAGNVLGLSPVPPAFPHQSVESAAAFSHQWLDLYLTANPISDMEFDLLVGMLTRLIESKQGGRDRMQLCFVASPAASPLIAQPTTLDKDQTQGLVVRPGELALREFELPSSLLDSLPFDRVVGTTVARDSPYPSAGGAETFEDELPEPAFTARAVAWSPVVTIVAETQTGDETWARMMSEGLAFFVVGAARIEPMSAAGHQERGAQ